MNHFRRLSLALLLALLLVGLAGHLILPASNSHHTARESTCAIHNGMIQPNGLKSLSYEPTITIGVIQDGTIALCLSAKISHPPTN
ncbi:MAG: hypothetical protein AB1846_15840 [Chloroflexota bacterium]